MSSITTWTGSDGIIHVEQGGHELARGRSGSEIVGLLANNSYARRLMRQMFQNQPSNSSDEWAEIERIVQEDWTIEL